MDRKIVQIGIDNLIPYVNNSRTHSDDQITQLASSIKEFGFTNPVLIDPNCGIIAGYGRVLAAKKLGISIIPCIVLDNLTDAQKKAYIIADNKLALNSGWDFEKLAVEIIDLLGFDKKEVSDFFLDSINDDLQGDVEKIEPVFEVSVSCNNEAEQEYVYNLLTKQGIRCRVLTI